MADGGFIQQAHGHARDMLGQDVCDYIASCFRDGKMHGRSRVHRLAFDVRTHSFYYSSIMSKESSKEIILYVIFVVRPGEGLYIIYYRPWSTNAEALCSEEVYHIDDIGIDIGDYDEEYELVCRNGKLPISAPHPETGERLPIDDYEQCIFIPLTKGTNKERGFDTIMSRFGLFQDHYITVVAEWGATMPESEDLTRELQEIYDINKETFNNILCVIFGKTLK